LREGRGRGGRGRESLLTLYHLIRSWGKGGRGGEGGGGEEAIVVSRSNNKKGCCSPSATT